MGGDKVPDGGGDGVQNRRFVAVKADAALGAGYHLPVLVHQAQLDRRAGIAAQLEPMLKDLPGVRFLDANLLPGAGCSPVDGMHLTPEAHKAVAEALKNALTGVTLL